MGDTGSGKPDVDDISLDDARPAKRSKGTGAVVGIILVVAIVAVLWIVMQRNAQRKAEEERQRIATQARAAQMDQIKGNLEQALTEAQSGNISNALAKLEVMENQLGLIVTTANTDGDQQAASEALAKKQSVIDARKAIEAEQATFQAAVGQSLSGLAATFGVSVPAPATATEAAPATGTEPAASTPAASEGVPGAPAASTEPGTAAPSAAAPAAPAPAASAVPAPVAP